jgi:hypothetical protein
VQRNGSYPLDAPRRPPICRRSEDLLREYGPLPYRAERSAVRGRWHSPPIVILRPRARARSGGPIRRPVRDSIHEEMRKPPKPSVSASHSRSNTTAALAHALLPSRPPTIRCAGRLRPRFVSSRHAQRTHAVIITPLSCPASPRPRARARGGNPCSRSMLAASHPGEDVRSTAKEADHDQGRNAFSGPRACAPPPICDRRFMWANHQTFSAGRLRA